ncbi:hypothetical protein SPI_00342 [Niveomyces insectorum RCEF 264]|uniref:Uncharacterized protein n=1 Tax=Niveomyces insectorum RCEF 264 TaxID=1081102 RepID=A0A168A224_9HYPO|nr:hypothetical protein SPI_00342 [Niveomyces insectorum RCEF 264]
MPTAMANPPSSAAGGAANANAGPAAGGGTSTPATPVKVPAAAASYTPATLDPDLRSQINMVLIRDGHVAKIQDHLLHVLNADPANWPAAVQAHALQLLRSGDCTNFPALMDRVMDDIRNDTAAATAAAAANSTNGSSSGGEAAAANGNKSGAAKSAAAAAPPSLALPQSVIDEALRVTRESLDLVCEMEE